MSEEYFLSEKYDFSVRIIFIRRWRFCD